jgi:hypothetical protein
MATSFLEPGGDADFLVGTTNGFWAAINAAPAVATDFVHGGHIKSIKCRAGFQDTMDTPTGVVSDAGGRISAYVYITALPTTSANGRLFSVFGASFVTFALTVTSAGVLSIYGSSASLATGSTLSTGQWYRISVAYTITSASVNRFEVFVNGVSSISATNITLTGGGSTGSTKVRFGLLVDTTFSTRLSDMYVDNSSSLTDTGNIWVTAKRPVSNGSVNGFTTQIGAGGSGYGTGHSPQVNERPLSTTNGWSMVGAGSAVTEEYNIEAKNVGDIDISTATIVDWLGWVSMKSLVGETVQIILNGANNSQAITSTATLYTKIKGSSTYPSGSGADIGIVTDTSLTTASLYECGVVVAYIPVSGPTIYTMVTAPASFTYTPQSSGDPVKRYITTFPAVFTLIGMISNFTTKIKMIYTMITAPTQFIITGQSTAISQLKAAIKRFFGTDY